MDTTQPGLDSFDPDRWGLPADAVAGLADRLHALWTRFRPRAPPKSRDSPNELECLLRRARKMP